VERLAELTGIEPGELLRIEAGAEAPTIGNLCGSPCAGVPLAALLRQRSAKGIGDPQERSARF